MAHYSIEMRTRKYVKGYGFLSFAGNLTNKQRKKYWIMLQNQEQINALKTASKKLVHKTTQATREIRRNKIADKIVKPQPMPDMNSRNVEKIVILPKKREEVLNR